MPGKRPKTEMMTARLPEDLMKELDAYVAEKGAELPGVEFNRTDAVRLILTQFLHALPKKKR